MLLELLTASAPAWTVKASGGARENRYLFATIGGEVRAALRLTDRTARWPQHAAAFVAEH